MENTVSPKQGILLLLLLLIIPIGIQFQKQKTRSFQGLAATKTIPSSTPLPTPFLVSAKENNIPTDAKLTPSKASQKTETPIIVGGSVPLNTSSILPRMPKLSITPFYNGKKEATPIITISGFTDPNASIDINIAPDALSGTTIAGDTGAFQYSFVTPLKPGIKTITITTTSAANGQLTKNESFVVVSDTLFSFVPGIIAGGIVCIFIGCIFLFRKIFLQKP